MNDTTICNKCEQEFTADEHRFGTIKEGDFVVTYLSCPFCGARYHVFTSDREMRELVGRRKAVQAQIRMGHAKKFNRKTLRKYEQELERIKRKQEKMMPALKAVGEKILCKEGSEHGTADGQG